MDPTSARSPVGADRAGGDGAGGDQERVRGGGPRSVTAADGRRARPSPPSIGAPAPPRSRPSKRPGDALPPAARGGSRGESRPGGASASPLAVLNVRVWLPIVVGPGAQFPRGQPPRARLPGEVLSLRDARSRLREVHRARRTGASRPLAHCKPAAHHVVNRTPGCHVPWCPDAAWRAAPAPGPHAPSGSRMAGRGAPSEGPERVPWFAVASGF